MRRETKDCCEHGTGATPGNVGFENELSVDFEPFEFEKIGVTQCEKLFHDQFSCVSTASPGF